jgi:hypothetical protein
LRVNDGAAFFKQPHNVPVKLDHRSGSLTMGIAIYTTARMSLLFSGGPSHSLLRQALANSGRRQNSSS